MDIGEKVWMLVAKLKSKLEPLISENNELISIFVTSVKTAKQNIKKTS